MEVSVLKNLKEIRTPLAFLSLAVVVTEGLLFALIDKVTGRNMTLITVGMVVLPFFIVWLFYLMFRCQTNEFEGGEIMEDKAAQIVHGKYELFVSAPMAGFGTTEEYKRSRQMTLDTIRGIKESCAFTDVFYAGQDINSFQEFDSEDLSVFQDYNALKNSENFILIYPQRIATSALVELGWAMVMNKPIILFVKKRDDLPYLMKNADAVYRNIAIYEYKTNSDIQAKFSANKRKLFEALTTKSKEQKRVRLWM